MKAAYTYAALYRISAVCKTPIRTGGTDGDTETVLRDKHGTPFLQGTTLAGAFRSWLDEYHADACQSLLGPDLGETEVSGSGALMISDGVFDTDTNQNIRPRLHIDGKTGTAKDKEKFDLASLLKGSTFRFTITWLGDRERLGELEIVEQMLAALNAGDICLGAQKANGFGRVSIVAAYRCKFDLMVEKDREAWLKVWEDESKAGERFTLPALKSASSKVRFVFTGETENLLVRDSAPMPMPDGEKGTYMPNFSEGDEFILPGSSVKGAVRARMESIAKLAGLDEKYVNEYLGRGSETDETGKRKKDGDNGKAGKVRFEDVTLMRKGEEKPIITRIRINKFTAGVIGTGLFKEQPVCVKDLSIVVTAAKESVMCMLLLFALRDLGLGLYHLGGGYAVGRGRIKGKRIEITDGDRKATLTMNSSSGTMLMDPQGLVKEWQKAWEEKCHG